MFEGSKVLQALIEAGRVDRAAIKGHVEAPGSLVEGGRHPRKLFTNQGGEPQGDPYPKRARLIPLWSPQGCHTVGVEGGDGKCEHERM